MGASLVVVMEQIMVEQRSLGLLSASQLCLTSFLFYFLLLSSLELGDTQVYGP